MKRQSALAKKLTNERERRAWTQEHAAETIGVGLRTWARWEAGEAEPVGRLVLAAVEAFIAGK